MIHFDIEKRKKTIEELSKLTEEENFWKDQNKSKKVIAEINLNKKILEKHSLVSKNVASLIEALNNDELSGDFEMLTLINEEFENVSKDFKEF